MIKTIKQTISISSEDFLHKSQSLIDKHIKQGYNSFLIELIQVATKPMNRLELNAPVLVSLKMLCINLFLFYDESHTIKP